MQTFVAFIEFPVWILMFRFLWLDTFRRNVSCHLSPDSSYCPVEQEV